SFVVRAILPPGRVRWIGREIARATALAFTKCAESLHVAQLRRCAMRELLRAQSQALKAMLEQACGVGAMFRQFAQVRRRNPDIMRHAGKFTRAERINAVQVLARLLFISSPLRNGDDDVLEKRPCFDFGGVGLHESLLQYQSNIPNRTTR